MSGDRAVRGRALGGWGARHPGLRHGLGRVTAAFLLAASVLAPPTQGAESTAGNAAGNPAEVLSLGVISPPDHAMTQAASAIGKAVEEATGGAMQLRVHHSSRRGNEASMLAQLSTGELDAALLTLGELARQDGTLDVFFMPYLAADLAEGTRIMTGSTALSLVKRVEAPLKVRLMGLGLLGLRHVVLTTNGASAGVPLFADGASIRVPPNAAIARFYDALGAKPQLLPLPVVRGGLVDGSLDGADMDLEIMAIQSYEGLAPYAILSGHMIYPVAALVSARTWNALDAQAQKTLQSVMAQGLAAMSTAYETREVQWRDELARRGMIFLPVPSDRLHEATKEWRAGRPELIPLADALRKEAGHAP